METSQSQHRQPILLMSNIRKIADLNLGDIKVGLMKDSVFGSLSSVTNKRESSASLVKAICKYYNPSKKLFELNNGTSFGFCSKEVADIIGMDDSGIDYEEYVNRCSDLSTEFPSYLKKLRTKYVGAIKGPIMAVDMKEILRNMTVDDDESKQQFRELMTYYLIEQVLLCPRNVMRPPSRLWRLVNNLDACETVNWAKATLNHLHFSMSEMKTWPLDGDSKQRRFIGAAPILETIIYERIPSMRPRGPRALFPSASPPVQKYNSQRKHAGEYCPESKLSQLTSADIVMCPHCTPSVENTPVVNGENVDAGVNEHVVPEPVENVNDGVVYSDSETENTENADSEPEGDDACVAIEPDTTNVENGILPDLHAMSREELVKNLVNCFRAELHDMSREDLVTLMQASMNKELSRARVPQAATKKRKGFQ